MATPSVLIVIDLQQGFVTDHSRHIVKPVEQIQDKFNHVVLTRFYNPQGSPFREFIDYQKLSPGDAEGELAIEPGKNAEIMERALYTCVNAELLEYLEETGAKEAYICGIATEACVLKTALDLFEQNIRCWVITDLCASDEGNAYHELALTLLAKLIGQRHLISSEDALLQIRK